MIRLFIHVNVKKGGTYPRICKKYLYWQQLHLHRRREVELGISVTDKATRPPARYNEFDVEVVIQNKPVARDPEGEIIQRNLVNRGGFEDVTSVRSGKYLLFRLKASSPEEARDRVYSLCNTLRIFNPVVHTCSIQAKGCRN
ncbi:MAG: phosphoribosylformylglycinamidine synthase subunit PurS [Candidatus Bathyarchaeia archaeon]